MPTKHASMTVRGVGRVRYVVDDDACRKAGVLDAFIRVMPRGRARIHVSEFFLSLPKLAQEGVLAHEVGHEKMSHFAFQHTHAFAQHDADDWAHRTMGDAYRNALYVLEIEIKRRFGEDRLQLAERIERLHEPPESRRYPG